MNILVIRSQKLSWGGGGFTANDRNFDINVGMPAPGSKFDLMDGYITEEYAVA
jgi:hypothetical protein